MRPLYGYYEPNGTVSGCGLTAPCVNVSLPSEWISSAARGANEMVTSGYFNKWDLLEEPVVVTPDLPGRSNPKGCDS
jgi:hypothetical protein